MLKTNKNLNDKPVKLQICSNYHESYHHCNIQQRDRIPQILLISCSPTDYSSHQIHIHQMQPGNNILRKTEPHWHTDKVARACCQPCQPDYTHTHTTITLIDSDSHTNSDTHTSDVCLVHRAHTHTLAHTLAQHQGCMARHC